MRQTNLCSVVIGEVVVYAYLYIYIYLDIRIDVHVLLCRRMFCNVYFVGNINEVP